MALEVQQLLAPYFTPAASAPAPLVSVAKRWGAGFAAGTLGLKEECVSLEPWRMAIAGDFVAERASPAEAAVTYRCAETIECAHAAPLCRLHHCASRGILALR